MSPRVVPQPSPAARRQRGVSLVESAIVLGVIAVVVGTVAPSFDQLRQRRQIEGAAMQLETDLHYARSLAVAHNQTLRMSFGNANGATCYVVHTGAAGACTCGPAGIPLCNAGAQVLRGVQFPSDGGPAVVSNTRSMTFDPVRGTVTPTATVRVLARNGEAVHQVVNVMGRVRSCTPSAQLPGYRRC
jgi:type IV fimbrial biogenesis protein FimT